MRAGQVQVGLHQIEASLVEGIAFMQGSPVRKREAERLGGAAYVPVQACVPSLAYPGEKPPAPVKEMCAQHPGQPPHVWCDDCGQAICLECQLDSHNGHKVSRFNAKFAAQKHEFERLVQDAKGVIGFGKFKEAETKASSLIAGEASAARKEADAWVGHRGKKLEEKRKETLEFSRQI